MNTAAVFFLSIALFLALVISAYLLLNYLEKNSAADWDNSWVNRIAGLIRLFCMNYHRLNHDLIPLPDHGCAILASNHISGLDPLLLAAASPRPLRFLIAREQYERFGLRWLFRAMGCIPVEREGRPERALREALRALKQGDVIALYPHGRIHLDDDPPRKLKAGVAALARLAGCPIYPIHLEGVRGEGYTLMALPMRSRARLVCGLPIVTTDEDTDRAVLNKLATIIDPKAVKQ